MTSWLTLVLGAIAGACAGGLVSFGLAARIAERGNYGQARATARLEAAHKVAALHDEFVQRAAIARRGQGFPAESEFDRTAFEVTLARAVYEVKPYLPRRSASEATTIIDQLVSEPARAVARSFPKGDAYDPSARARFQEAYVAKLASADQGPQRLLVLPPPPGPLLLRSWRAPLVGDHHDDVIALLDRLLMTIDPRRSTGTWSFIPSRLRRPRA